ncbi:MAG: small basic family protein [Armatimonadetes bacterium]|nr:small basic family protein [Armatimonadota bacterium]
MLLILGVLAGLLIGMIMPFDLPLVYAKYVSCGFLAALDSVLGAIRAGIEEKFNFLIFVSGFFVNAILAGFITFLGDRLGVDLYFVAVITFGMRIFENLTFIRLDLLSRFFKKEF